ncbi:cystin-1 isoform X1 [Choloepus didactylus]|uniref:cystin-1 isoform X1 n=1 Tax=Choloepus didactylus TaxID=27675 RepID=UPI00189FD287|nr:cystin-1 isoform X1 [Choloepus didactylus]
MGSGSSRSSRALRRLRSPNSRPAGPGGAAPEGGAGTPATEAAEEAPKAAAVAAEGEAGPDPDPDPGPAAPARPAPSGGGDETLRLLDQLLAESATWVSGELAPRRTARPAPAPGAGSPEIRVAFPGGRLALSLLPRPLVEERRCPAVPGYDRGTAGWGWSWNHTAFPPVRSVLVNPPPPPHLCPPQPVSHQLGQFVHFNVSPRVPFHVATTIISSRACFPAAAFSGASCLAVP